MGDRGNIRIMYSECQPSIYFYAHWRGSELLLIVQRALIRGKSRWDDESYLARIIFCELVKGEEGELTGFGIAPYECDSGPLVVVGLPDKTVCLNRQVWTFDEFIATQLEGA